MCTRSWTSSEWWSRSGMLPAQRAFAVSGKARKKQGSTTLARTRTTCSREWSRCFVRCRSDRMRAWWFDTARTHSSRARFACRGTSVEAMPSPMTRRSDASVPDHKQLMRFHIEALYTHDSQGRMLAVNDPGGAPAPRVFLGRTPHGNVWRIRHDVPEDIAELLNALCAMTDDGERALGAPGDVARFEEVLARSAPVERVWTGPAFHVPIRLETPTDTIAITNENRALLEPNFTPWLEDVGTCQPFFAAVSDGQVVSVCGSVRTTRDADEAGVETHPAHRGRGHAPRVVLAWASAVRAAGRLPLYSTSWQNTASRAVARKLGLVQIGSDLHIT